MREPYTIPEVMKYLGISESTTRRMIRSGVLKESSRDPHNRILVDPDSVDAAAIALGRVDIQGFDMRRELAPTVNNLSEMVTSLNQTIQMQNERLISLAQQLGEAKAEARLFPQIAQSKEEQIRALEQALEVSRQAFEQAREEIESLRQAAFSKSRDQGTSQTEITSIRSKIRRLLGGE
jgi:methyl-accepting chemotaxis protein